MLTSAYKTINELTTVDVFDCSADEIVRTLGEGTFGKVAECKDLHR